MTVLRLAFFLALALPAVAGAQSRPNIAVVGLHQPGTSFDDEKLAVGELVTAITATNRFDAIDASVMQDHIRGREEIVLEEAFFGPGRRLLDDGRLLYEQAQPADAIPVLQEAVETLRVGMSTANSSRDLWE